MHPGHDAPTPETEQPTTSARPLVEVAALFLKLGIIGFGGPAAHIAMMRDEVVARRRWVTDAHFLDLIGATNLIPGPNSTEMAMHLGYVRAGRAGLMVGGALFILPAMLIVMTFAWAYVQYGSTPQAGWLLYGIKPVIIAVIAQALWGLGRTAIKTPLLAVVGSAVFALYLLGFNEIALLFGGALVVLLVESLRGGLRGRTSGSALLPLPFSLPANGQPGALLAQAAQALQSPAASVPAQIDKLKAELAALRKSQSESSKQGLEAEFEKLAASATVAPGGRWIVAEIGSAADTNAVRDAADKLRGQLKRGAAVLALQGEGKLTFLAAVTDDLVAEKKLRADELVRAVAKVAGGSGGGKPHLALAGAKEPDRLDAALAEARRLLTEAFA
jgi:chromate transport protein ChrA